MCAFDSSYSLLKSDQPEIIGFCLNTIKDCIFFTLQKDTYMQIIHTGTLKNREASGKFRAAETVSEGCVKYISSKS